MDQLGWRWLPNQVTKPWVKKQSYQAHRNKYNKNIIYQDQAGASIFWNLQGSLEQLVVRKRSYQAQRNNKNIIWVYVNQVSKQCFSLIPASAAKGIKSVPSVCVCHLVRDLPATSNINAIAPLSMQYILQQMVKGTSTPYAAILLCEWILLNRHIRFWKIM